MSKKKEEQQRRKLEFQHFDLKKFKITKDGVDVTHHESGNDAGEIIKKGEVQPHPDLQKTLDQLKLHFATRLGLLQGWDYSREKIKKDEDALKGAIDGHKEAVARCKIGGLTFVGEGETYGVIITGNLLTPNGGSVGLAVPKITFGLTKLGYEEDVKEICEEVKKEVYAYRFQSKKAQLDIETEIERQTEAELLD